MINGSIIGCGSLAKRSYIPIFKALKGVELVAVCDRKEDLAAETARHFNIPKFYTNLGDMIKDDGLDFVTICTPPVTHSQLAIEAMNAGLHVLVEKPMALNTKEADEIVFTSRQKKAILCVAHNFLFTPVVQKAKFLVQTGAVGEILGVDVIIFSRREGFIRNRNHWCHSQPGGILSEYSPHAVYLESAFLGKIKSVKAIATQHNQLPWIKADELKVILDAEKGLGSYTISCNSPRTSFTMDIFGTQRSLHVDNFAMTLIQHKSRLNNIRDLITEDLRSTIQLALEDGRCFLRTLRGERWYRSGHRVLVQRFIESIRNDIEPPVSAEDGRETITVMEEIFSQIGLRKEVEHDS